MDPKSFSYNHCPPTSHLYQTDLILCFLVGQAKTVDFSLIPFIQECACTQAHLELLKSGVNQIFSFQISSYYYK
jgi:hypothetical protein